MSRSLPQRRLARGLGLLILVALCSFTACSKKEPEANAPQDKELAAKVESLRQSARREANRIHALMRREWARALPHADELKLRSRTLEDFVKKAFSAKADDRNELRRLEDFGKRFIEKEGTELRKLVQAVERLAPATDEVINLSNLLREGLARAKLANNVEFPLRFSYARFNDQRHEWIGDMRLAVEDLLVNGEDTRIKVLEKNIAVLRDRGVELHGELKLVLRTIEPFDRAVERIEKLIAWSETAIANARESKTLDANDETAVKQADAELPPAKKALETLRARWTMMRGRLFCQELVAAEARNALLAELKALEKTLEERAAPLKKLHPEPPPR